jgi:hypothetical protein
VGRARFARVDLERVAMLIGFRRCHIIAVGSVGQATFERKGRTMDERHRRRFGAVVLILAVLGVATASTAGGAPSDRAQAKQPLPRKTIGVMGPINAAEIIKLGTDAG